MHLWDQLTGAAPFDPRSGGTDPAGPVELLPEVQSEVARRWESATAETIGSVADVEWFRAQFRALYGFDVPGVDYAQPVDPDLPWPGSNA